MADHDSTNEISLDLASLDGEDFEKLVAAIFRAKSVPAQNDQSLSSGPVNPTVIEVLPSGRGADQGRDMLVTTVVNDGIHIRKFRWLVQCKHNAKSRKSVQPKDVQSNGALPDVVAQHQANGYLLVCSTTPSANLQTLFERLTAQDNNPYIFTAWDETRVCEELNRHLDVLKQYFPEYYRRYYQKPIEIDDIMEWAEERGVPAEGQATLKMALDKVINKDRSQVSGESSRRRRR
jgi:hypothetical protein